MDNEAARTKRVDGYFEASKLASFSAGKQLIQEGSVAEGIELLKKSKEETQNLGTKAVIDITIAQATIDLSRKEAATNYIGVYRNEEYPPISRAYALLMIAQYSQGFSDSSLLKEYFSQNPEAQNWNTKRLLYELHKDIFELYPYGISASYILRHDLEGRDSVTEQELERINDYIKIIDTNIQFLKASTGMKSIVPNTMLSKALLFQELEDKKIQIPSSIQSVYEEAITYTSVEKQSVSQEFMIVNYSNYLLHNGNREQALSLLKELFSKPVSKMLEENLSNEVFSQNNFPELYRFTQSDSEFAELFGAFK